MLLLKVLVVLFLGSCTHVREIGRPEEAMRLREAPASLSDDLDRDSLIKGLRDHIAQFSGRPSSKLRFGTRSVDSKEYGLALQSLLRVVETDSKPTEWLRYLKENFDFYEIFGKENWGEVYLTSYFDPVIRGSLKPSKEFTQPLYRIPDDLVVIRMNEYIAKFPALDVIRDKLTEQKSGGGILRGRLRPGSNIGANAEILPYFDREEIDSKLNLKGRKLELCYVDPIDAFVMQIQGSGTVLLDSQSELKLGYASQNGHPYVAVGKFLTDRIPLEEMSLQRIESYLKGLSRDKQQEYLNRNPSYVFFQTLQSQSLTTFGTEVIAGRTIATDPRYFPKGALGFLQFEKPQFQDDPRKAPEWVKSERIVFDQDTGGAIRGPARLDLYWGKGGEAKQHAGVMKNWGRLMYLAPKEKFLSSLKVAQKTF